MIIWYCFRGIFVKQVRVSTGRDMFYAGAGGMPRPGVGRPVRADDREQVDTDVQQDRANACRFTPS
jgi:hypothetical protein